jgi:hypothetical protein
MTTQHSHQLPASACEELCDDSLQEISGGVSFVIGKASLGKLPGIGPIRCTACVQGFPRDLVKNPLINPAIKAGFKRF